MKKQIKMAVLAVVAVATAATSHGAANNGDLLVGFTVGTGNDLVYDLGATVTAGQQWNLSALLSGYNLNNVSWGVVGNTLVGGTSRIVYTTRGSSPLAVGQGLGNSINTADGSLFVPFATAGAGQFVTPASTSANSWNVQTVNPTLPGQYKNVYGSPNMTGIGQIQFWQAQANLSAPVGLDNFKLDANGILTYGSVPEPATFGILGGLGVLAMAFRHQLRRIRA